MGKSSCRYVVNAVGKCGETYYTHCQDKHELNKWIAEHKEKIIMDELKINDKSKNPLMKLFNLKNK